MLLTVGVTTLMALFGVGLAYARVRRAVAAGARPVHVHPARGLRGVGPRSLGLALLIAGGLGAQLVEQLFTPLSRSSLLQLAAPPAAILVAALVAWLSCRRAWSSAALYAVLGAPLFVYALIGVANAALDGAAPVTERVTVLDKQRLPGAQAGVHHVALVQRADAKKPVSLRVDAGTWDRILVGRDSAELTTRAGRFGVRWLDGAHPLRPLPPRRLTAALE